MRSFTCRQTGYAGSNVWAAAGPIETVPMVKIAKARIRIGNLLADFPPFRPRPDFQIARRQAPCLGVISASFPTHQQVDGYEHNNGDDEG
jgi:hypothetical protein